MYLYAKPELASVSTYSDIVLKVLAQFYSHLPRLHYLTLSPSHMVDRPVSLNSQLSPCNLTYPKLTSASHHTKQILPSHAAS
jgi:hypothetical protein